MSKNKITDLISLAPIFSITLFELIKQNKENILINEKNLVYSSDNIYQIDDTNNDFIKLYYDILCKRKNIKKLSFIPYACYKEFIKETYLINNTNIITIELDALYDKFTKNITTSYKGDYFYINNNDFNKIQKDKDIFIKNMKIFLMEEKLSRKENQ